MLEMYGDTPTEGMHYPTLLTADPDGLLLASENLGTDYGLLDGWNSWILKNSPDQETAGRLLKNIARDERSELPRKMMAVWLLWEIEHDKKYLLRIYETVKEPDGPMIGFWRGKLATAVNPSCREWIERAAESTRIDIPISNFLDRCLRVDSTD